jgi:hypothetical protein
MEGDVFLRQAEKITAISSFEDTSYIGCTGTAAYLSFWRVGRWRNIVYWTPLRELPDDLAKRLQAGERPWKDPMERRKEKGPETISEPPR